MRDSEVFTKLNFEVVFVLKGEMFTSKIWKYGNLKSKNTKKKSSNTCKHLKFRVSTFIVYEKHTLKTASYTIYIT